MYGTTGLLCTPHAPSSSAYACFCKDTQKKDNTQLLSTLSTHVMSAISQNWDATLGPQIGSHFLGSYITSGPEVKVGFLTGFSFVQIHSPNSKLFQLIQLNRAYALPILRCIYHQQLPSSIFSRSDLAAASTCCSCS